jgi:hypothetical protein
MSTNATIQGLVTYKTKYRIREVVESLTENGWMKDSRFVEGHSDSDVNGLTLRIPYGCYRNLIRRLDFIVHDCQCARIVWTSTDGMFHGGVFDGERETTYELSQWAMDNIGKEPPNPDDDFQEYCEWMSEVENAFHGEFGN